MNTSRRTVVTAVDDPTAVEVSDPEVVEVSSSVDGKTLWVNVDGVCRLRAARIRRLIVDPGVIENAPKGE